MTDKSILVKCTAEQRERIKAKAGKTSMSQYLLNRGLNDDRVRDGEDSAALAGIYRQLCELNQTLKALPSTELVRTAIQACRDTGKEIVLYRLSKRIENEN